MMPCGALGVACMVMLVEVVVMMVWLMLLAGIEAARRGGSAAVFMD